MTRTLALAGAMLVAGCATTAEPPAGPASPVAKPATSSAAAPTRARPSRKPPRMATPLALPGLEAVIGVDTAGLVRLFGPARLDLAEGDARKLQWSGDACVLDAYLYPPAEGREPVATYVDTRGGDGREVDRATCVAALRLR